MPYMLKPWGLGPSALFGTTVTQYRPQLCFPMRTSEEWWRCLFWTDCVGGKNSPLLSDRENNAHRCVTSLFFILHGSGNIAMHWLYVQNRLVFSLKRFQQWQQTHYSSIYYVSPGQKLLLFLCRWKMSASLFWLRLDSFVHRCRKGWGAIRCCCVTKCVLWEVKVSQKCPLLQKY